MPIASDNWNEPCYPISQAAEMAALHPQTLRRYEVLGLVAPVRKAGRRLYSSRDIDLVRQIARLSGDLGLNMAGVEVIIRLNERIRQLQAELEGLRTAHRGLEAQVARLQAHSKPEGQAGV
ncbi:MAG: MerR family transcriptional regulator [Chloroflexi bacterium]|nr:MerR family transcriptional regulator [Chloroflexota bacterium]